MYAFACPVRDLPDFTDGTVISYVLVRNSAAFTDEVSHSSLAAFLTFRGIGYILRLSSSSSDLLFIICSRSCLHASRSFRLRHRTASCSAPALRISSESASILALAASFPFNSHSHTVITVHPSASRCAVVTSSLCLFLAIFASQNSLLL